ncbi:MAG: hypothetical protein ACETWM_19030 [Candidatus Lokiarchaeia archaeon]
MNKNRIFVIILIIVATASVVLISGYFKKAVYENNPDSETFGIYTATLGGKNMKPLITNSWQQMSHARVSPDKKWVTFTRYTNRGKDGYATENEANYERGGEQYLGTEVLIMRIDGTDVRTLIPHQKDRVAANSYWTPDGKGIIYVSAPNEKGRPQINHIIFNENMEIKNISKIPIPEYVIPTDPHWVGDWIVFPATEPVSKTRGIWRIKYNGAGLRQLTWPKIKVPFGDNDPKLSPDGSKVAFIRRVKKGPFFHVVVVDVNTKEERDFSAGYLPQEARAAADLPPEWSSDGKLLIFPHILADGKKALSQIHTIKPDGTGRKRVPLPRNYVYFHTSFFPGEGSGKDARIIFSARKMGNLGKRQLAPESVTSGSYERINIVGETAKKGVYDLSIEYDEDGTGWLAYTALDWINTKRYLHTHLAKTTVHGKTWTYVKRVNVCKEGSVTLRNGREVRGIWRPEVPTLVHDPDDPGKEWKLFWHKYFAKFPCNKPEHRMPGYGWIAYRYASDPAGPWSKEIALFGGIAPFPPFKVEINLNKFSPDLKNVLTYTEPGSLVKDGVLYLSLQAIENGGQKSSHFKTILLSSYDHGKTWKYAGTLTDYKDAAHLSAVTLTASSLAQEKGRAFLLISPTKKMGSNRQGTYIFEFEDISKAKLKRDKNGKLIVHKYLKPSIEVGKAGSDAGESDYDEHNTYGGIIMCQAAPEFAPIFGRIFNTKEGIVSINLVGRYNLPVEPDYEIIAHDYEKIEIINDPSVYGAYDLALEYENEDVGYMVYTSVNPPAMLHTHLAKTTDNGKTWTFIKRLTEAYEEDFVVEDKVTRIFVKKFGLNPDNLNGTFVNEVPTLVYVPDDVGKEWKLLWHKYLSVSTPTEKNKNARTKVVSYGWIMLKEASTPEGLDRAEEIKLFSTKNAVEQARFGFDEYVGDDVPISAYSEQGALYKDGILYVSMAWSSIPAKKQTGTIFLVKSEDYGKTWEFVGRLITSDDTKYLGYERIFASSLADEQDRIFLLVTPIKDLQNQGTFIIEFENLEQGKLKRDKKGNLIVHKYLKPSLDNYHNAGQSDYDKHNTYGGIIMPQQRLEDFPNVSGLYNTREGLICTKQLR